MNNPANLPWWEWGPARQRLITWTAALLHGRRRRVQVASGSVWGDDKMGWESPTTIFVNPPAIAARTGDPPDVVWNHARAVSAHEVGHARFTGELPEAPLLHWLANALEDERVERGMSAGYPYLAPDFDRIGCALQRASESTDAGPRGVVGACLLWRWEHDHPELPSRIALGDEWRDVWENRVRPLVEEAWAAASSDEVVANARAILAILGLPEDGDVGDLPDLGLGLSQGCAGAQVLPPAGAGGGEGPGVEQPPNEAGLAPYLDLERQVEAPARRLAELLCVRPEPDRWERAPAGGRYSLRQALRTPEEPYRIHIQHKVPDVTFGLLLDVSGSMTPQMELLREAAMMTVVACEQAGVRLWLGAFADYYWVLRDLHDDGGISWATTKARVAGLETGVSTAMLNPMRALVEALAYAENPFGLVIADGQPYDKEVEPIRALTASRPWLWGCYVGDDPERRAEDLPAMRYLFHGRVIEGRVADLPVQIGNILRSLRGR